MPRSKMSCALLGRAAAVPAAPAPVGVMLRYSTLVRAGLKISARPLEGGGWMVWVHIADVSAYVTPRSPIDREAYKRGTSVYVPGAVEPMLPPELSNGACSLVPGEDRYAVTVELLIRGVEVLGASFYRSVIRSDRRLTYEDVDSIFDSGHGAEDPMRLIVESPRPNRCVRIRPR